MYRDTETEGPTARVEEGSCRVQLVGFEPEIDLEAATDAMAETFGLPMERAAQLAASASRGPVIVKRGATREDAEALKDWLLVIGGRARVLGAADSSALESAMVYRRRPRRWPPLVALAGLALVALAGVVLLVGRAKSFGTQDAPVLEVLDQGRGERVRLRYDLREGTVSRTALTVRLGAGVDVDAPGFAGTYVDLPPLRMHIETRVVAVDEAGRARCEVRMEAVSGVGAEGHDAWQIRHQLTQLMRALEALEASYTLEPSGVVTDVRVSGGEGVRADARQHWDSLEDAILHDFSAALPEVPVGVGAVWEVRRKLEQMGMVVEQTETFELLEIDAEGRARLSLTLSQRAARQDVELPGLPSGAEVVVESLKTEGSGEVVFDPRRPDASEGGLTLELAAVMRADAPGAAEVVMKMLLDGKFELEAIE